MAIREIIAAIDKYIDDLREARRLLSSISDRPKRSKRAEKLVVARRQQVSAKEKLSTPSISSRPVSIRVIPPVAPRQPRTKKIAASPVSAASAKFIAQGPVIVSASELKQKAAAAKHERPLIDVVAHQGMINHLDELAKEVRRRMTTNIV